MKTCWHLQFAEDKTDKTESTQRDSFLDGKWMCRMIAFDCDYVTFSHPYQIHTTVTDNYRNILTGSAPLIPSLNCGAYPLGIEVVAQTYQTYEAPIQRSGAKALDHVYVDYNKAFGSRVIVTTKLDGETQSVTIIVPRDTNQTEAAKIVENSLYQFLIAFIATLNTTNNSYYLSKQNILRDGIAVLRNQTLFANSSLLEVRKSITIKAAESESAKENWHSNLLFLLLPLPVSAILSLATYFIAKKCKSSTEAEREGESINPDSIGQPNYGSLL